MKQLYFALAIVISQSAAADTLWDHNSSIIRLESNGSARRMIYDLPRPNLPVKKGQLLFDGTREGNAYKGTISIFSSTCGESRYSVAGDISADEREIILRGRAPRRNNQCMVIGYRDDELVFRLRPAGMDTATSASKQGPEAQATTSTELSQAIELLSVSFACPLPPRIKKEVRNGVMLFYNATTFNQRFTGDANQLRFISSETFAQKSEPGLGGNYEANYNHEYAINFRDIRDVRLHDDENDPRRRRLRVVCIGGRECSIGRFDGRTTNSSDFDISFCDAKTAQNALLAIKILMQASRR